MAFQRPTYTETSALGLLPGTAGVKYFRVLDAYYSKGSKAPGYMLTIAVFDSEEEINGTARYGAKKWLTEPQDGGDSTSKALNEFNALHEAAGRPALPAEVDATDFIGWAGRCSYGPPKVKPGETNDFGNFTFLPKG